eukprot:1320806-Pyramimonas_sp.AAC.1
MRNEGAAAAARKEMTRSRRSRKGRENVERGKGEGDGNDEKTFGYPECGPRVGNSGNCEPRKQTGDPEMLPSVQR